MPRPALVRSASARLVALAGVALICVACAGTPDVMPSISPPSSAPDASPGPSEPADPTLHPDGSASDNLPLFEQIITSVWLGTEQMAGRAYVDALVAVGFDKTAMEVTNDRTSLGKPIDTLMFSVRWNDECLIGQVGPSTGDPLAVIQPLLASGTCMVGMTRPIDW